MTIIQPIDQASSRTFTTCEQCYGQGHACFEICARCQGAGGYWHDDEPTLDERLAKLGRSLKEMAKHTVQSAKQYTKDTPVQRRIRKDMAKDARRTWRDGQHYERTYSYE